MSPERERPDPLEDELRAALHSRQALPPAEADELLNTVHRRVARRRLRRRAGGAIVAVAGVVSVGVATTQWPTATAPVAGPPQLGVASSDSVPSTAPATSGHTTSASPAPDPEPSVLGSSSSEPSVHVGEPVRPDEVEVESLTAVQGQQFWVLGTGRCAEGSCQVIARTTDAGETFSFRAAPEPVEPSVPTAETEPPGAAEPPGDNLRYEVAGRNAWGYDSELWSSHDAGRTWQQVELPVESVISSVQSEGEKVWAFGTTTVDGGPVILSSPVGSDAWSAADPGLLSSDRIDVPIVADDVVGFLVTHVDGTQTYVRSLDAGVTWEKLTAPACDTPLAGSGVEGALWLYCASAEQAMVAVSTDSGTTWQEQPVPQPQSDLTTMTGIDTASALVTDAATVSIASVGTGIETVRGPYTESDDVWEQVGYVYAEFTDPSTGYLITSGGRLARSDDGGRTWTSVELP